MKGHQLKYKNKKEKTKIGLMFIEISGLDGEGDVREGVMDKTEKVINTYPLHTLLGHLEIKQ